MHRRIAALVTLALGGCGDDGGVATDAAIDGPPAGWSPGPALPAPIANNAVVATMTAGGCTLWTATGIGPSRMASAITAAAWTLPPGAGAWTALPPAPGEPRIAASAVALRGKIYVLGGYSVGAGGAETTRDTVAIWDPATSGWSLGPSLPTAIDDAVVVAWRDRWIVVVSGWSNTAPVAAVQVFDVEDGAWRAGTPFAGTPVFGHAGALVGDEVVVVDGVASGARGFVLTKQAWAGRLDPASPTVIAWRELAEHPGPARYRAAAGAWRGQVLIHGGTAIPYNFDGLSYADDSPAPPLADAIAYDPVAGAWSATPAGVPVKPAATMDHRGLVGCGDALYTVGGMIAGPTVTAAVWTLR